MFPFAYFRDVTCGYTKLRSTKEFVSCFRQRNQPLNIQAKRDYASETCNFQVICSCKFLPFTYAETLMFLFLSSFKVAMFYEHHPLAVFY